MTRHDDNQERVKQPREKDNILCAGVAWLLFSFQLYSRLNSFLRRCIQLGYTGRHSATITVMFQDADDAFFVRYYTTKHAFFAHTYPPGSSLYYSLRSRNHSKSLIDKTTDLNNCHFLIRALYNFNFNFMHMPCLYSPWTFLAHCLYRYFVSR